jgi:hypothetical protein
MRKFARQPQGWRRTRTRVKTTGTTHLDGIADPLYGQQDDEPDGPAGWLAWGLMTCYLIVVLLLL